MPLPVRFFLVAGVVLIAVGLLYWAVPNAFSWFGRLPGDIRHETENSRIFIPIASMIVLSVILTVVVNLVRLFWR